MDIRKCRKYTGDSINHYTRLDNERHKINAWFFLVVGIFNIRIYNSTSYYDHYEQGLVKFKASISPGVLRLTEKRVLWI